MFGAIKQSLLKKITWDKQDSKTSEGKKASARKAAAQADMKANISRPELQLFGEDPFKRQPMQSTVHVSVHPFLASTTSLLSGLPSGSSSGVQTPDGSRTPTGGRSRPQGIYGAKSFLDADEVVIQASLLPPPRRVPMQQAAPSAAAVTSEQGPAQGAKKPRHLVDSGTFGALNQVSERVTASPSINSMSSTDSYSDLNATTHSAQRMYLRPGKPALVNVPGTMPETEHAEGDAVSIHSMDSELSFGDVPPPHRC